MRKTDISVYLAIALGTVVVAGVLWYEHSLWKECRQDHSWFYCMRVLGH